MSVHCFHLTVFQFSTSFAHASIREEYIASSPPIETPNQKNCQERKLRGEKTVSEKQYACDEAVCSTVFKEAEIMPADLRGAATLYHLST